MDYLAEHRSMLELAASGGLPRQIDESSELSVKVCRELVEAGLLDGIDARTFDGDAFLEPRITVSGREYLNELQRRSFEASPAGRARRATWVVSGWVVGVLTAVLTAWIIWRLGLAAS